MGRNPNHDSSCSGLLELSGPSSENRIPLMFADGVCMMETRLAAGGRGGSIPGRLRVNIRNLSCSPASWAKHMPLM